MLKYAIFAVAMFTGCTAVKGTRTLVDGERALYSASQAGAETAATHAWFMADEYMKKAREEWGYSEYEAAEGYAIMASQWAAKAESLAVANVAAPEIALPEAADAVEATGADQ